MRFANSALPNLAGEDDQQQALSPVEERVIGPQDFAPQDRASVREQTADLVRDDHHLLRTANRVRSSPTPGRPP